MNHYYTAKFLARLLDTQFSLGKFRFGLDPLLDFIPGLGDVIALLLSLYIVWIAKQYNVPDREIAVMMRNIMFDFILGLIPIVGYIGDFVYKANIKNLAIIEKYLQQPVLEGEVVTKHS